MICAKMKTILGIVLCLSVLNLPYARGDCAWGFYRVDIDDTEINKDIYEYIAEEDFEIKGLAVTQADGGLSFVNALTYFQYNKVDRNFTVQTTEEFGNLNSDAYTDGVSLLTISLVITLTCSGTDVESTLMIAVTNTNQNAPEYSQESYTYSLPMPIMPKTDFSLFGDEMITATDIDFSTDDIIFSVNPDDFAVTSLQTGNKTFRAVFSANKILRFTESQIYTLTASDSGLPPKTTPVTITLSVDPTAGLDSPAFSSAFYSYNYTGGDTLIPTSGDIVIVSDKSNDAKYALTGDYSDSFTIEFINDTNTFSIALKQGTSLPVGDTQFVLTLSYTTDATIYAVILISIVKDETKPEFSKNYYIGTYDIKSSKISWNEPVAIKDAGKVELSGDKSSLFQVDPTTYEITPINTIPTTDFDENANLFLTLIASLGTFEARATVVISLPSPDELKFDSSYYSGEYTIENEKGFVSLDGIIGFSDITDFTGITVTVDNSYSDNFKIEQDASVWKVTVLLELNSTTLNAYSELAIPIAATKAGETTTSTAILILTLPDKVKIKFTDLSYTANYIKGSGTDFDTVILDKSINVEGAEAYKIAIVLEDYSKNFEIVYDTDSSSYKVNVKANLDASTLETKTQLIITITATDTDAGVTANTILVLALPEKTSVTFEKKYYAAKYVVDDTSTASVQFTENRIKISGADFDKLKFNFEDYNDNFEMEYDTNLSLYNINVKGNLDSSILDSKTELIITIIATVVEANVTTDTVLVLTLPEKTTSFNFENQHYAAEYIVDTTSKASVKLIDTQIKVAGANDDQIQFDFEGYNNNFVMEYNATSFSYNINVKNNLDSSILDSETQLIITITATVVDANVTTNTVLILALPEQTISFEEKHYAAEYIVETASTASVKLSDTIKVTGADSDKIVFKFEGYDDNFEMQNDNTPGSYKINVKNNLNSSILTTATQIVITITATDTDKGATANTVLILALPEQTISFEEKHYAAEYIEKTASTASVKLSDMIKVTGADSDKIVFKFEGYDDNFEMQNDNTPGSYKINVKNNLNSSILTTATQIVITITATDTDKGATANTVLILALPEQTISFEEKHYAAEYIEETASTASVKLSDTIKVTGADSDKIVFKFEGYDDNFEMQNDNTPGSYKINVKNNLNSSILTTATQIVITITATDTDKGATANTVLILALPEQTISFEEKHYAAEYIEETASTASVKLSDTIKVTGADSDKIVFKFEGYDDNFEMQNDNTPGSYKINVKNNLNSSILTTATQIVITITATEKDKGATANTVLILALPEQTKLINFEEKHYAADYIVETASTASVKLSDTIKVTGADSDKIVFRFEGYDDNFEMQNDNTPGSYKINVKNNLNSSILTTATQIVITITATEKDKGATANTVLILALPEQTKLINFEEKHYAAEYIVETASTASVKLSDTIKVTGADSDKIVFKFEGYDDNFEMQNDNTPGSYKINVKNNLNSSILTTATQIVITITATEKDKGATANTVLILALPEQTKLINFEEKHYAAEYIIETASTASVKLSDTIKVTGADSEKIVFKFEGYDDNFEMQNDNTPGSYKINVKNNLNSSILTTATQIVITITATEKDKGATANTVLILALPEQTKLINFEEKHYAADYIVETASTASVKLSDTIKVTGADSDKIVFKFEGYDDNFEMQNDNTPGSYKINVKNNLNSSILTTATQIVITITATDTDKGATANTVLILALPEQTISFEEKHYAAEYIVETASTASVKLSDTIKVTGADSDKIVFKFEGYDDNFEMQNDNTPGSYKINVKNNLNSSILTTATQIVITITATEKDKGATANTVLILALPEQTRLINFEEKHYAADYIVETASTASVKLSDTIKVTGADSDKIVFKFEGYDDNFEMQNDNTPGSYKINVKNNLNSSILTTATQIVITITATEKDKGATANTVLILALPEQTKLINFEEKHYAAEYIVETASTASVKLSDTIKVTGADSDKIVFKFEGYDDNFEMQNDNTPGSYKINVKNNLNSSILTTATQIVITITATEKDKGATANTVLILALPEQTKLINFEEKHYAADYIVETASTASVKLSDTIKVTGADSDKIVFKFEGYDDNFEMQNDNTPGSYKINVKNNLNSSILTTATQIVITITATEKDKGATANTVLILALPEQTKLINFEEKHYAADYIVETASTASVKLSDTIKVTGADSDKIVFKFEGYDDNFEMQNDNTPGSYKINVKNNLNSSILTTATQIVITITATEKDKGATANTVLILALPEQTKLINFEEKHYAAEYIVDTNSKASVRLMNNSIKVTGASSDQIEFIFEGYNENFEMKYDTTSLSYHINVKGNLDKTILDGNTELLITITAVATNATDSTVLVLKLPEKTIAFLEQQYTAKYVVVSESEGNVLLDKDILITNAASLDIHFSFIGYEEYFDLQLDEATSVCKFIVKKPLDDNILLSYTQLVLSITAFASDNDGLTASTVLVLRLPSDKNSLPAFQNNYYVATYKVRSTSGKDQIEIKPDIKIKSADFAEGALSIEGYEENFIGTCESSTLLCTISVKTNLNSTILSSKTELLLTVDASNKDESRIGKTVLLLKLPSPNSTFTFAKQHYSAIYTIEETDGGVATVTLNDTILFNGVDPSEVTIDADEYSDQFIFVFDSTWNVNVQKNLDSDILSKHTELIISLTATKTKEEYSKATLVIKLPDKTTIAFLKPQYTGKYIVDGSPNVVLTSEIETTDTATTNIQITLDDYGNNFEVKLSSESKWIVNVISPLGANIFTENSQLKLLMTITKAGVKYGEAALIINLPDPIFSQGFYTATYSDDNDDASISSDDIITVRNVEAADIQVNLSKYNDYIYTDLVDSKWVLKVSQPLTADITQNYDILQITLQAIRNSDNQQLTSSTLVIKLPALNSTTIPKFTQFTFYGDYKNSSTTSSVDLAVFIGFTNSDMITVANVFIEEGSSEYSTNFIVNQRDDKTYDIEVSKNLPEDVLSTESSIVLTLVASTAEGDKGYATLVINLPKVPRETSVHFEDEKFLYSGTYENGTFNSPPMTIETNSTDSDLIVVITNELGIDDKHFSYTFKNNVLAVSVDNLPVDILSQYAVIPLKLAITDAITGDTVHAVLNVNINYKSDDGDDPVSTHYSLGLLIAVIILSILLIAVIVAVILLWYFKIRNARYVTMEEEEEIEKSTKPTFTKNLNSQTSTSVHSNSSLRRPTGLPIAFVRSESPTEEASSDFVVSATPPLVIENEKKVAFNENVQNIDDDDETDNEELDDLQNVADRRPTQYVFGNPMAGVPDSPLSERRESSDYIGYDPEIKKSVVFDDNVERMDIDVDDANNSADEEDTESYNINDDHDLKLRFKAELEVKLEEEFPNETFNETL